MRFAIAVTGILLLAGAPLVAPNADASTGNILIAALEPATYVSGQADESIVLINQGSVAVDVSGWRLADAPTRKCSSAEGILEFPPGTSFPAGATWVITQEAAAWRLDHLDTLGPAWEWADDTDASVPDLIRECGRLQMKDSEDEVFLFDATGAVVDAVAYGDATPAFAGWTGPAVPRPARGDVIERDYPEDGSPRPDTDSAADFDDWRRTKVGQNHWPLATFTDVADVTACASPDSSFEALQAFVDGAQATLDVELYEWTNIHILDAFLAALSRGVTVRVLMEGGPVGMARDERDQQNHILNELHKAGADVRFMVTNSSQNINDRYLYLHQKMAIRDAAEVFVMSGNWKSTGLPTDPTYGNREWCVAVASADLAAYMTDVFEDDSALGEYRDVIQFGTGTDWRYLPPTGFAPDTNITTGGYPPLFPREHQTADRVTPIMTPDTSLFETHPDALIPRMQAATEELLVEQMTLNKHWGSTCCGSVEDNPSPLLEAVIDGARNGALTRILLGHEFIDPDDTRNNRETCRYVNAVAADEGLDMHCKIVDAEIGEFTKIHNKGIVIDGDEVYVGSMNWGLGSATNNREIGLLLAGGSVASYYRELFWYDWNPPDFKPVTNLRADALTYDPATTFTGITGVNEDDPAATDPDDIFIDPYGTSLTPGVFHVTVTNDGKRGAADHDVQVQVFGLTGQTAFVYARVPHISSGETVVVDVPWRPLAGFGFVTATATVDVLDEVPETNDDDNTVSGDATLVSPGPGVWVDRIVIAPPRAP